MTDAFKRRRLTHKGGCTTYDAWHNPHNRAYRKKHQRITRHGRRADAWRNE